MFILANLLSATATVLGLVLQIYLIIVVVRAVISWVNPDPYNPIVRFLRNATDPLMIAVRQRLPVVLGGIDLSPIVIIVGLIFLQAFLVQTLHDLARRLH